MSMSRRRQINPVALILIALGAGMGASSHFGITNPTFVVLFIVSWLLPIPRMVLHDAPRSIHNVQSSIDRHQYGPFLLALLGTIPWVALPALHRSFPESVLWQSLNVPEWLRWVGVVLTCGLVCKPWIFRRFAPMSACVEDRQQLLPFAISAASIVLISANPFIALVAAAGMVTLSVARWMATHPRSQPMTSPELQHVHTGGLMAHLESTT
jgi:hypothetical protein